MLSARLSTAPPVYVSSLHLAPLRRLDGLDSAKLGLKEGPMWHTWRKAVIALAIAMIPVYIGLFLAHKQQEERNQRSVPATNPCEGHGASL